MQLWSLGSGRCPGGGNGNPLQYSCLENPMDRGAWRVTIQGVTESQTQLNAHTHIHTHTPSHCARQPVDLGTGVGPGPALRKALRGFMKIRKAESFTLETSFNAWQPSTLGSPGGSVGREFTCYAGEPGLIPRWGRSPGEGNGNPLQYFCLRNPMDRGA